MLKIFENECKSETYDSFRGIEKYIAYMELLLCVIPAKAGIHCCDIQMDTRLRGYDNETWSVRIIKTRDKLYKKN